MLRAALEAAGKTRLEEHAPDPKTVEERLDVIRADIKRLLASITPVNAKYIDEEIVELEREREALEGKLE